MILDDIVARKRQDLEQGLFLHSILELERAALATPEPRDFYSALAAPGLSLIAEVKRASPSKGLISKDFDYLMIAGTYELAGASALSVLTEPYYFLGENAYLTEIKNRTAIPVLRKDFLIDERQVLESRALGADAILLIAAILSDKMMTRLANLAGEYGMHCLYEAHNELEINRILACNAKIIGINNRDLRTFEVNLATFESLSGLIPSGVLTVAESGIMSAQDARRMQKAGAVAVLAGEVLMRSENPGAVIKSWKGQPYAQD